MWHIYTMYHYLDIKRNVLQFTEIRMDLEMVTQMIFPLRQEEPSSFASDIRDHLNREDG